MVRLARAPRPVSLAELLTLGYLSESDVRPGGHVDAATRRCAERDFLQAREVGVRAPVPPRVPPRAVEVVRGDSPVAHECCCVCLANRKDRAVVPCFHMCVCAACSRRIRQCPVCRGPIDRLQRIFM